MTPAGPSYFTSNLRAHRLSLGDDLANEGNGNGFGADIWIMGTVVKLPPLSAGHFLVMSIVPWLHFFCILPLCSPSDCLPTCSWCPVKRDWSSNYKQPINQNQNTSNAKLLSTSSRFCIACLDICCKWFLLQWNNPQKQQTIAQKNWFSTWNNNSESRQFHKLLIT